MSVFFLAEIKKVTNEKMYGEYTEKASPIISRFGGEYVFKSEQLIPMSGDWELKRIILIHFDNKEKIQECFQSDEYKEIAHLRENSTISKALIIED